jgi:uncharacterized membrane protein YhiD involved in acid resistance
MFSISNLVQLFIGNKKIIIITLCTLALGLVYAYISHLQQSVKGLEKELVVSETLRVTEKSLFNSKMEETAKVIEEQNKSIEEFLIDVKNYEINTAKDTVCIVNQGEKDKENIESQLSLDNSTKKQFEIMYSTLEQFSNRK